jgi:hypothetical protein
LPAEFLELSHELTAAVDLDSLEGEWCAGEHALRALLNGDGGGAGTELGEAIAGDDVDEAEVLEMGSGGEANIEGVELAEVTGLGGHVVAGLAPTVVAQELAGASSDDAWRLVQEARRRYSRRMRPTIDSEIWRPCRRRRTTSFLLAPARVLAEVEDRLGLA